MSIHSAQSVSSNIPSVLLSTKKPNKIPLILSLKIRQCVLTWRKRAKNSKHRWNILKEWVDTEKNYIRDLEIITTRIQKPMVDKEIISQSQQAILFRNVDTIIKLSTTILQVLEGFIKKQNWKPSIIQISQLLLKLHPFLKIYIEYCNHYYKGQNILKSVKNLPQMIAIEKSLPMDIDSYLIKPIQRPPKYMLLLRDYKKHLPQNHPDYKRLCQAIDKYHQVNQINNNAISQQQKVAKMVYLQKLYGQAMQSNRQYIREFDACTYKTTVKVYVLTDLLIVTEIIDYKQTVSKIVHIDNNSFLHRPQDGKYFINILFICGKYETIHLMFDSVKQVERQYSILRKLLRDIQLKQDKRRVLMQDKKTQQDVIKVPVTLAQKKQKQQKFESFMRVVVDGVQKRPISTFKTQTYYIIKYKMPKPWFFYKLNYTRYSAIQQIYNYVKKHFPQLTLPDLSPAIFDVGIYDQTKNKTQIMEYRCMAIQDFLNRLLRWQKIMSNPIFFLQTLKINNNLWQFAIVKNKCTCQLCLEQKSLNPSMQYFFSRKQKFYYEKQKMSSNNFCMWNYALDDYNMLRLPIKYFNTISKIYPFLNAEEGKTDESRMYYPPQKQSTELKIAFINLLQQHSVTININRYSTIGQILRKVAISIGIKYFGDFGLFVKYSGIPRLLDTDELIYDVLNNIQQQEIQKTEGDGFFGSLKQGMGWVKKWGQQLVYGKKSKLVIKKYLFLPQQLEVLAYKQDPIRFNLILEQAFYYVYCQNVTLSEKQLLTICAMFVCLKSTDKLIHIKKGYFPVETLGKILPPSKRLVAQNNKWMKDLLLKIDKYKDYVLCQPSKAHKLYEYVMQIVQDKITWDAMMTTMSNYQPQTLQGSPFTIQVGISHKHLFVIAPKSQMLLLQIPLQVLQYKITAFSLFIDLNDCKYRFDAKMVYNMKKMIQKYKQFQRVFGEQLNCTKSDLFQSKYMSMKSMRL